MQKGRRSAAGTAARQLPGRRAGLPSSWQLPARARSLPHRRRPPLTSTRPAQHVACSGPLEMLSPAQHPDAMPPHAEQLCCMRAHCMALHALLPQAFLQPQRPAPYRLSELLAAAMVGRPQPLHLQPVPGWLLQECLQGQDGINRNPLAPSWERGDNISKEAPCRADSSCCAASCCRRLKSCFASATSSSMPGNAFALRRGRGKGLYIASLGCPHEIRSCCHALALHHHTDCFFHACE